MTAVAVADVVGVEGGVGGGEVVEGIGALETVRDHREEAFVGVEVGELIPVDACVAEVSGDEQDGQEDKRHPCGEGAWFVFRGEIVGFVLFDQGLDGFGEVVIHFAL